MSAPAAPAATTTTASPAPVQLDYIPRAMGTEKKPYTFKCKEVADKTGGSLPAIRGREREIVEGLMLWLAPDTTDAAITAFNDVMTTNRDGATAGRMWDALAFLRSSPNWVTFKAELTMAAGVDSRDRAFIIGAMCMLRGPGAEDRLKAIVDAAVAADAIQKANNKGRGLPGPAALMEKVLVNMRTKLAAKLAASMGISEEDALAMVIDAMK
jgi:hypothetical protein